MMCWHLRELHICSKWKGLGSENLVSQKIYPTETYIESKNNVLTFSIRTKMDWSQEASVRSWLGSALHEHGFSCGSVVNNLPANAGDAGSIPGLGRSPGERRQWHPTPVLLPGKSHGWRSLVGCSPWGRWGSDTTEWLPFHFSLSCIGEGNGNPLQCSFLENPRDGGAWWAAVYWVAQSRTRLKWLCSSSQYSCLEKFHGQRSLVDLSPWGCQELDMTETAEHTCATWTA